VGQIQAVADLLARSDASFIRTQRRYRTGKIWGLAIPVALYALMLFIGFQQLLLTWRSENNWLMFWAMAGMQPLVVSLGITRIAIWTDPRAPVFAPARLLRQAARSDDDEQAPIIPQPASTSDLVIGSSGHLGPMRRPSSFVTRTWLIGIAVLTLISLAGGVSLAVSNNLPMVALILAAVLAPVTLALLIIAWRLGSPFQVDFDEIGVQWRGPLGRRRALAWSAAGRFICVNYLAQHDPVTIVSMSGEREALIWRVNGEPNAPDLPSGTLTLWTLIVERTGLHLRDLSREAHLISARASSPLAPSSTRAGRAQKPSPKDGLSADPPLGTTAKVTQDGELARSDDTPHRMKLLGIIGAPAIVLVVVSLVLMLAQRPYFEWQYAQSHGHAPLYTSSLAQNDGLWSALPSTRFNDGALEFVEDTSYDPMFALLQPLPRDGLYEVTTTIAQGFELGGAGWAVVAPDGQTPTVEFWVDSRGGWWVERQAPDNRYDSSLDRLTRLDTNDAIHKGYGAPNRLAILKRSADMAFFVNGQYMTGAHDDGLANARVGVYMSPLLKPGESGVIGTFRDLAVYPAP
jgi:hypothetical protein